MPICASNNRTFWSECDMKNYTCLHPNETFSILRYSPCDEGQFIAVQNPTSTGVNNRYVYKCSFGRKVGQCKAYFKRYYFDQDQNRCLQFGWGGCDQNGNNFESLEKCESDCRGLWAMRKYVV